MRDTMTIHSHPSQSKTFTSTVLEIAARCDVGSYVLRRLDMDIWTAILHLACL